MAFINLKPILSAIAPFSKQGKSAIWSHLIKYEIEHQERGVKRSMLQHHSESSPSLVIGALEEAQPAAAADREDFYHSLPRSLHRKQSATSDAYSRHQLRDLPAGMCGSRGMLTRCFPMRQTRFFRARESKVRAILSKLYWWRWNVVSRRCGWNFASLRLKLSRTFPLKAIGQKFLDATRTKVTP